VAVVIGVLSVVVGAAVGFWWLGAACAAVIALAVVAQRQAETRDEDNEKKKHDQLVSRALVGAIEYAEDFRISAQQRAGIANGMCQPFPFGRDLEPLRGIDVEFPCKDRIFEVLNYIQTVGVHLNAPEQSDEFSKGKGYWEKEAGDCEVRVRHFCREVARGLGMDWTDPPVRRPPNASS
jgi:hypothetical protein